MKILLVRPPRIKQAITLSDFMFSEPLGLEMIYSVVKEKNEVEIFDMMIETTSLFEKILSCNPEIIGITSLCIDVKMVIKLCKEIKNINSDIITIIGGTQTFLNPASFFHEDVDYIFEYTNLDNITELFHHIFQGKVNLIDGIRSKEYKFKSTGKEGRNEYIIPDRESTEKYRREYSYFGYKPAAIMEFGVGCNKCCDFCLRWRIEGAKENLINLDITKEDLKKINEPTIMFIDNDFFASEEKIRTFINVIKELNISKNYIMYGSVNGIMANGEYVPELAKLGLKAVLVGYETFNEAEMFIYKKKSSPDDNYEAARILREAGIDVWASFIAHPDWDKKDFISLRAYIKKLKPQITSISPLTPFPNLPMHEVYKDRLIYNVEDYEKWSFGQVMIKPSQINLRRYYYELLITNLYINIFVNKNTQMIKKFGIKNISRIFIGSLKAAYKYIVLMIEN